MNRRAAVGISLTVLASLLVGIIVLLTLGRAAFKYIGDVDEDKSEEVPRLATFVLAALGEDIDASITRSIRADKRDLFLFYSKGLGDISLTHTDEAYGSFVFERPEECNAMSCVCYCKGSDYWQSIEDEPFLALTTLTTKNTYTCPTLTCAPLAEDIEFINSRGDSKYDAQFVYAGTYKPLSMDIVAILNYLQEKTPSRGIAATKNKNPFFTSGNSGYTNTYRATSYTSVLSNYRWSGGFVVGGYGVALSAEDIKKKSLATPPVTLRLENKGDGILGICLQETCLFEEKLETIKTERAQRKLREELIQNYDNFRFKVERAPSCQGGSKTVIGTCDPTLDIQKIFFIEGIADLKPQLTFELQEATTEDTQQKTIISFKDVQSEENSPYTSLSTPFFFLCEDEKKILQIRDLTIVNYEDGRFIDSDGKSCKIVFSIELPAPATT